MKKFLLIFFLFFLVIPAFSGSAMAFQKPVLQVNLPFVEFTDVDASKNVTSKDGKTTQVFIPWISEYLNGIYRLSYIIAGILAVVMIMVGGIIWSASAGNQAAVGKGKEMIMSAIIGLFIILLSYTILYTINPALTSQKGLLVQTKKAPVAGTPGTDCTACKYTTLASLQSSCDSLAKIACKNKDDCKKQCETTTKVTNLPAWNNKLKLCNVSILNTPCEAAKKIECKIKNTLSYINLCSTDNYQKNTLCTRNVAYNCKPRAIYSDMSYEIDQCKTACDTQFLSDNCVKEKTQSCIKKCASCIK